MSGRIYRPDSGESLVSFPEAGRLSIGEKRKGNNGKEYPVSLDYFRARGTYAELFTQVLGQPKTIQILFPDDDASKVCNERYELRDNAGALVAEGDGRIFKVWNGKKYQEYSISEYPDIMERLAAKYPRPKKNEDDNGWDITLTMRFLIPAIRGVVGAWQLTTKGAASSIRNIRESFDTVQTIRGTVTGTIFDLSVKFAKSNKPGAVSRYPVISLIANDTCVEEIKKMLEPVGVKNLLIGE